MQGQFFVIVVHGVPCVYVHENSEARVPVVAAKPGTRSSSTAAHQTRANRAVIPTTRAS